MSMSSCSGIAVAWTSSQSGALVGPRTRPSLFSATSSCSSWSSNSLLRRAPSFFRTYSALVRRKVSRCVGFWYLPGRQRVGQPVPVGGRRDRIPASPSWFCPAEARRLHWIGRPPAASPMGLALPSRPLSRRLSWLPYIGLGGDVHGTTAATKNTGGVSAVDTGGGGSCQVAGSSPCLRCDRPRRLASSAAGAMEGLGLNDGSPLFRFSMLSRIDAAS